MATITTDQQLETEVGTLAGAGLPAATATKITVDPATEELGTVGTMVATPTTTPTADQGTAINTTAPTAPAPNVGQVAQIDDVSSDLQQ